MRLGELVSILSKLNPELEVVVEAERHYDGVAPFVETIQSVGRVTAEEFEGKLIIHGSTTPELDRAKYGLA